jgi:hypothetical protein
MTIRGRRLRWTNETDAELRQRIAARQPLAKIAREMGRTMDGVRGRAAALRITLPSPTRPWRETVKRSPMPKVVEDQITGHE